VTRASDLLAACALGDVKAALDVGRAYLDEQGEIPARVVYELALRVGDPVAFEAELDRVRAAWFGARGLPVPPAPSGEGLE